MTEITKLFEEKIKSGPDYVCTCCHRMMYRPNVRPYHKGKFSKLTKEQHAVILEAFMYTSTDGRTWICVTCERTLQKGKMPRQAKANGLGLFDIPHELSQLNEVEMTFVSQNSIHENCCLTKGETESNTWTSCQCTNTTRHYMQLVTTTAK